MNNLLTIGIPAFNEEVNIGNLIQDILDQEELNIRIEKIIIASDGSTDKTVKIAKSFKDKRIVVLDNLKRDGLAERENQIIGLTRSDILVILNADTRIKDEKFIEKLTLPIVQKKADLTSPYIKEVKPEGIFEKILLISMKIKDFAYEEFKKGNNVYTCHGQARAFSRRLYRNLFFPSSIGEDAYSYFFCIKKGFDFKYIKSAQIVYRLPANFSDHEKQSLRFFQSQKLLSSKFGKDTIKAEYRISEFLLFLGVIKTLQEFPLYTILYLVVLFFLKIKSQFSKKIEDNWSVSISSKTLGRF